MYIMSVPRTASLWTLDDHHVAAAHLSHKSNIPYLMQQFCDHIAPVCADCDRSTILAS